MQAAARRCQLIGEGGEERRGALGRVNIDIRGGVLEGHVGQPEKALDFPPRAWSRRTAERRPKTRARHLPDYPTD